MATEEQFYIGQRIFDVADKALGTVKYVGKVGDTTVRFSSKSAIVFNCYVIHGVSTYRSSKTLVISGDPSRSLATRQTRLQLQTITRELRSHSRQKTQQQQSHL